MPDVPELYCQNAGGQQLGPRVGRRLFGLSVKTEAIQKSKELLICDGLSHVAFGRWLAGHPLQHADLW